VRWVDADPPPIPTALIPTALIPTALIPTALIPTALIPTEGPPPTRIPGIVVLRELVAQAEDAAVMLLEARGYSQGCLLEFLAVARPAQSAGSPVIGPVIGIDFGSGVHVPGQPADGRDPGRAVHRLPDEPGELAGSVGTRIRLWVAPLPPAEGVTVVTEWPERDIRAQRQFIGTEGIRVAAWESFPCLPA
jgi:hypothetical protein